MENAVKADISGFFGSKILYIVLVVVFTCIISRCPLMGDSFVCGIALIAYMLSKNAMNIYLILPAAASLFPYILQGYEPQVYISAMVTCGLVFTSIRKVPLALWQRGAIAGSTAIITISVYSLISGTVYKTAPAEIAAEGLLIVLLIYIFDALYIVIGKPTKELRARPPMNRLPLTAFVIVSLMIINGMSLAFLIWPAIIFIALWTLSCIDAGMALFATATGSFAAFLMEQGQWGLMATIMLGILAASYAKAHGFVLMALFFAGACLLAGYAESGVVLGVDEYCLLLPTAAFVAIYLKFGERMSNFMSTFAAEQSECACTDNYVENILKDKSSHMADLTELYSTYLDSRSMLANQFNITRQIIDEAGWQMSKQGRRASSKENNRFDVDIAISQCAASGAINGDCCGWQDIGGGRVVMIISDGMGKGKKAAAESLMVTKTMLSLLKSGVTVDLALKMINTIMLMKDDEDSYATLDMVTVDKHSGKAKFYKIGAAPTLIRRRSNVEEVKLSAVPLGIVNGLKVRYVETTLKKDDRIIMMSDGVSDGGQINGDRAGNSDSFLRQIKETAADVRSADPQTMCDLIMNRAADSYIGRERDDLTVMVARIL